MGRTGGIVKPATSPTRGILQKFQGLEKLLESGSYQILEISPGLQILTIPIFLIFVVFFPPIVVD